MQKTWSVLTGAVLGALIMVMPASAQMTYDEPGFSSSYDQSALMQDPSSQAYGMMPPGGYYPDWQNYLDQLQRQGGYYAVTGNYPNSAPVTSYYPASPSTGAQGQQYSGQGGGMYYNPQDYYSSSGQQAYPQEAYPQQAYGQQAYPQQAYGQQGYAQPAYPQQTYQQAPSQQGYAYQGSQAPGQTGGSSQQSATGKSKKRRLTATQRGTAAQTPEQPYQQAQQSYAQQTYPQQSYPQQAYQQPGYQQPYDPSQQGYQQGYQQQAYPQGYQQPQQAYGQQAYPQQQGQQQAAVEQEDPALQQARMSAYERAVARQRAAEIAAQQQAAIQELQQVRQQYDAAQARLREQEDRQRAFQEEYRRKAAKEAYEQLRAAQQRYYDLVGVSGESGRPETRAASAGPAQGGYAPPSQMPVQAQQYGGPPAPYQQGYPTAPQSVGMQEATPPGGFVSSPQAAGQVTPLHVQQQPQAQGGGFWSTIKEIFAPPTGASPSQRSLIEDRNKNKDLWGG